MKRVSGNISLFPWEFQKRGWDWSDREATLPLIYQVMFQDSPLG